MFGVLCLRSIHRVRNFYRENLCRHADRRRESLKQSADLTRRFALSLSLLVLLVTSSIVGFIRWPFEYLSMAQEVIFTKEYLNDPIHISLGKEVWLKRCKFCHGKTAYPGKAPKLQPSRYTPEFVYDRVTNGFRGMPSWKHEFSEEERKAVVAYILSKAFSN